MIEVIYYLTLGHLERFPDRFQARYALHINHAWVQAITTDVRIRASEYEAMVKEARHLMILWNSLDDVHIAIHHRTPAEVMEQVAKMRALIGEHAYQTGVLPYPVPLHRVHRLK